MATQCAADDLTVPPRFPFGAALYCAACVGTAAWLWLRYSYAWSVTPADLNASRAGPRNFPPWRSELVAAATAAQRMVDAVSCATPLGTCRGLCKRPLGLVQEPLINNDMHTTPPGPYVLLRGLTLKFPCLAEKPVGRGVARAMTWKFTYEFLDPDYGFCSVGIRGAHGARSPVVCADDGTAYCYGRIVRPPGGRATVDPAASRLTGQSVAGLAVGAMGVFIFSVAFRHWLGERRRVVARAARA